MKDKNWAYLVDQGYEDEIKLAFSVEYNAVQRKLKIKALNFEHQEYYSEAKLTREVRKQFEIDRLENDYSIMLDEVGTQVSLALFQQNKLTIHRKQFG